MIVDALGITGSSNVSRTVVVVVKAAADMAGASVVLRPTSSTALELRLASSGE
jgi:hypothetical protein